MRYPNLEALNHSKKLCHPYLALFLFISGQRLWSRTIGICLARLSSQTMLIYPFQNQERDQSIYVLLIYVLMNFIILSKNCEFSFYSKFLIFVQLKFFIKLEKERRQKLFFHHRQISRFLNFLRKEKSRLWRGF